MWGRIVMTKRIKYGLWFCLLLIVIYSAYLFYHDATTTQVVRYDPSEMLPGDDFADFTDFTISEEKADGRYGEFAVIGPFSLEKGTYNFIISYQTDSDLNAVKLTSDSEMDAEGKPGAIYDSAILSPDRDGIRLSVTLTEDIDCVKLKIYYYGGFLHLGYTNVEIQNTNRNLLISYLLLLTAVAFWSYLFFVRYRKSEHRGSRWTMLLLTALILYLCSPLMNDFLIAEGDRIFHLARVYGIYTALRDKQFPMWLNMYQLHGDGYATPIMYPQLFLFIPALLELAGMDLLHAYKTFYYLINVATVLVAYLSFRRLFQRRREAIIATYFYSLGLYHLICLYTRDSLGENLAYIFLPLLFVACKEIFTGDYQKWILLTVSIACILQSHIVTTLMAGFIIIIFFILFIPAMWRDHFWHRIFAILKAAVTALLLNLFFLIPFLDYYKIDFWAKRSGGNTIFTQGVYFSQLFSSFVEADSSRQSLDRGTMQGEMALSVGFFSLIILIGYVVMDVRRRGKMEADKQGKLGQYALFGAFFCLILSAWWFPWELIDKIPILRTLITIQFSWRFLGMATLFLSILSGILAEKLIQKRPLYVRHILILFLSLTVLNSLYYLDSIREQDTYPVNLKIPLYEGTDALYLRQGVDADLSAFNNIVTSSEAGTKITGYKKRQTTVCFHYQLPEKADTAVLDIPLYDYPGYVAEVNGQETKLSSDQDDRITLTVNKPEGNVEIRYKAPKYWNASYIISFVTFLVLILTELFKGHCRKYHTVLSQ